MFSKKNISIRTAILTPLGIIILLLLAFVISIYIATIKLNNDYISLYRQSIPEIAKISSLIDECKNIHAEINNLFNQRYELVFFTKINQIKQQLSKLNEKTKSLEVEQFNKSVAQVLKQIQDLQYAVYLIDENISQSINLYSNGQNSIKHLHYLQEKISEHQEKYFINEKLRIIFQDILVDLFVLNSSRDMSYNVKIYNMLTENHKKLIKYGNMIKSSQSYENEQLNNLISSVLDFLEQNGAIPSLIFTYDKIQQENSRIQIFLAVLYGEINQIGKSLFEQTQSITAQKNEHFEHSIQHIILLIIGIFSVIILSTIFIYFFLSNYILSPLTKINNYIKSYSNDKSCKALASGASEVQEIALAICDFAEKLEDREQKLRNSHKNLQALVVERTKQIRMLSNQIISLQEEERFKLAAELHDDIGSSLSTIKLAVEHALLLLKNADIDNAEASLDSSIQVVKSVSRQLRRIQTDLRPPCLDVGLLKTLEWFVEDYRLAHPKINLEADFFFDDLLLSASMRIVIFRLIQESMNNVSKHSQAENVCIKILDNRGLTVLIVDDGKGFDLNHYLETENKISHGIRNIQERVSISGGVLKIYSKQGRGMRVIAHWKQENTNSSF